MYSNNDVNRVTDDMKNLRVRGIDPSAVSPNTARKMAPVVPPKPKKPEVGDDDDS